MENMAVMLVVAAVAALAGAAGAWLALQGQLKQAQHRTHKYEQLRKQLEQQKAQAFKQIEQLQADLTDLRREQALHDAPRGKSAKSGQDSVGGAALLASEPYFDSDSAAPEGFAQTQITLTPHSKGV
ncbi:hypothetical protein [Inhella sp.]|uniref:hypothetical protein n=1 Tax=Inhella sp. TaxID=1921806 RepID=UPI0035AE5380